jgi:DNA-binding NtrC family response regulator
MTQFKLDLSKLFDLQVLLIEADPELLHLFKQMLQNLGLRKIETARQIDDLMARDTPINADIVFLDYAVDTQMTRLAGPERHPI